MSITLMRSVLGFVLGGALCAGCIGGPAPESATTVQSVDQATYDACRQACLEQYDQCEAPCEQARYDCYNDCYDPANREDVHNAYQLCGLRPGSCCTDACDRTEGACSTPCITGAVACISACSQ